MEQAMLAALLAAVFFAQLYASSVGGASLLTLPIMFLAGIPANVAVATNRAHFVFTASVSSMKFLRNVKVAFRNLALYSAASIAGALLGAVIVINLDKALLRSGLSAIILVLAVFFLIKKDLGLREQQGKKAGESAVLSSAALFAIGIYRSIVGSGSGTFLRIYFVIKEGLSFLQSATYSSVIAVFSNAAATAVFALAGIIDYQILVYMVLVGVVASYIGAHIAIRKGNEFVRKVFLLLAIITSLRLIGGVALGI